MLNVPYVACHNRRNDDYRRFEFLAIEQRLSRGQWLLAFLLSWFSPALFFRAYWCVRGLALALAQDLPLAALALAHSFFHDWRGVVLDLVRELPLDQRPVRCAFVRKVFLRLPHILLGSLLAIFLGLHDSARGLARGCLPAWLRASLLPFASVLGDVPLAMPDALCGDALLFERDRHGELLDLCVAQIASLPRVDVCLAPQWVSIKDLRALAGRYQTRGV